ncbi:hypothetical protein GLOIN_2v1644898 [Rhizophagus irregularis DAOM 181602=DAOM 197198]|uniref:Transposase domain-containing protein n=1 Tax=Rhizophagus irregularis (strain DAOM 181602 / DAOM 197198 / MUCL 43194) TaxID=747089 RepID=A0A2P4PQG0_RHIID|nr:hypothetical protein GLOIN_2v1644898 [Rhizophagus irregularis DAOM 181602=DAOM 197198]POG67634.1 hypothetical protein GLOIN_2v1644898 [Rhizophagus irregularis DAOM 181602=DAOM 197198]|eukprot:XP_025174500.1 hypothetical protein GLOIN_2v1644898 [Rhizophagus irregularis DAOM 181602=DAOM 197198]
MPFLCSCRICKINSKDGNGKWLSTRKTFKKHQKREKANIEKINESEAESGSETKSDSESISSCNAAEKRKFEDDESDKSDTSSESNISVSYTHLDVYKRQSNYSQNKGEEEIYADIFDGLLYKDLLQRGFFKDERDIALSGTFQCIDGRKNEPFILHAHLLTWTGDVQALSKSLNLSGHNSYKGCHFCMIKGTYHPSNKHIYYPSSAFCNIKNHDETINMGKLIEKKTNKDRKDEMIRETGIKGSSELLKLQTLLFPWSFPTDIMHLFFENVVPSMYAHWSGKFFYNNLLLSSDYELSKLQWKSIGIQMEKVKKDMPIEIGRPPRDIFKYHNGYKAVYLDKRYFNKNKFYFSLHNMHLQGWVNFVKAVKLCLEPEISEEQIDDVQILLKKFSDYYEREYYQNNGQRLAACKISLHYLLHVANSIKYCGPSWTHWQFPMERVCGILQPLIKSKIKPYSNLANMLTLLQQFYMLPFFSISKAIFKEKPLKQWSKERVFSTEGYEEEFYSPSTQYSLLSQEHKHLIKFYKESSNINRNDLEMEVNNYGVRYRRLRTSDGQYISSCCIKRNNKIARNNYCDQIRRTIDKLAHRPNAPPQLVIVDIYGIVNYYLVHEFNHQVYMLAYVQLTSKIVEDEYGCKHFTQFRSKEFIDVRYLDHCIGFAKIDNRYYIIDKENAFDDSNWENIGH